MSTLPKICLNMIVKNESKIITRLFDSVLPLIDTYCICDTGSTDNTIELIRTYFDSHGIPGKIIHIPFKDFAYNRTKALNACEDMLEVDYLLLMDADMVLRIPDKTKIPAIKAKIAENQAHYLFQGSDKFFYKNVRIVKNGYSKQYRSVTHEYIETPSGTQYGIFDRADIFIEDIGDGGSKADKFERDIRLLLEGLKEEPNNDRYHFYIANSYRDAGQYETAIEYFKKRVNLGGWYEEVWYSFFAIGNCYQRMGNMEAAVYYWMMAYNVIPNRLENLYRVIKHYRESGKNELAYMYYHLADMKRATLPKPFDFLFMENDVYNYKLDYELSIIGYYCNYDNYDLTKICTNLISNPMIEDWMYKNILSNYKFYSPKLAKFATQQFDFQLTHIPEDFVSSTPSVVLHKGEVYINTRLVNYSIDDKGNYTQKSTISTENIIHKFSSISDIDSSNLDSHFYKKLENNYSILDNLYVGTEDVRMFSYQGQLLYNGNRGLGYKTIVVEHGDVIQGKSSLLTLENQGTIEKNWILFEDSNGSLKCIYHWWPLQIGDIDNETSKLTITHRIETPACFKHARGSTNGVRVGNEIWFICHIVSYEDRRYYYHILVALDPTTYEVLRYSRLFTFEGDKVEYTLGFVYDEPANRFLIGYSTMDRTTKFMIVSKDILESAFFLC